MAIGEPREESRLKKRCNVLVKKLGGVYLPLAGWVAGTPDALIILQGNLLLVEFKTETGRVTPIQEALHKRIAKAGYDVPVIRSFSQFKKLLTDSVGIEEFPKLRQSVDNP